MRRITDSTQVNFLTLTVVDWVDVFTRRLYNDFVVDCLNHCQQRKGLQVFAYVLMTNHLHLVAQSTTASLSDILRDFKTFTAKELLGLIADNPRESRKAWLMATFAKHGKRNALNTHYQFWQNENYPVALSTPAMIDQKIRYIHQNPVKAGFVNEPHDFYYSSAHPLSPVKIVEV